MDEDLPHSDEKSAVWVQGDERNAGTDENRTEDDEHTGDDETGRKLMRYCNEDRPPAQATSIVVRSSSKPFITIHDQVTRPAGGVAILKIGIVKVSTAIVPPSDFPCLSVMRR